MSNTYKIERARALYGKKHKKVKLIKTGVTGFPGTCFEDADMPIDNGGQRWGNQRKMRAKMKVDARKAERKKLNKNIDLD